MFPPPPSVFGIGRYLKQEIKPKRPQAISFRFLLGFPTVRDYFNDESAHDRPISIVISTAPAGSPYVTILCSWTDGQYSTRRNSSRYSTVRNPASPGLPCWPGRNGTVLVYEKFRTIRPLCAIVLVLRVPYRTLIQYTVRV